MQPVDQLPILNVCKLPDFPKYLNIHENETFTNETWSKLFARAVDNYVPNYAIAIVPLKLGNKEWYSIYDALAFRNFLLRSKEKHETPKDPLTRGEFCLEKVKFMAVKCFDLEPTSREIRQVPLQGQEFRPFYPTVQNVSKHIRQEMNKVRAYDEKVGREEQPLWDAITAQWNRLYPPNEPVEKAVVPTLKKILQYALDGVNPHNIEHLTMHRIQNIVSNAWDKLIDIRKAKIWKFCSEKHKELAPEHLPKPKGKKVYKDEL